MAPLESEFALHNEHKQKHRHFKLKINHCRVACPWKAANAPLELRIFIHLVWLSENPIQTANSYNVDRLIRG